MQNVISKENVVFFQASRHQQTLDIALLYACSSYTTNLSPTTFHLGGRIDCWCFAGNDVTDLSEIYTLPLGECVNRFRLIDEGWDVVEELEIDQVYYFSDTGKVWCMSFRLVAAKRDGFFA